MLPNRHQEEYLLLWMMLQRDEKRRAVLSLGFVGMMLYRTVPGLK